MKKSELIDALKSRKDRSAWDKGVTLYAIDMIDGLNTDDLPQSRDMRTTLLSGAESWEQYSYGGCSLIYDHDIATRLCCPSELKRNRGGDMPPNAREEWIEVQSRALHAACRLIMQTIVKEV